MELRNVYESLESVIVSLYRTPQIEASLRRSVSNLGLENSDGSPPDGFDLVNPWTSVQCHGQFYNVSSFLNMAEF